MVTKARKKTVADDIVNIMADDGSHPTDGSHPMDDGWGSNASDAAHFAILEKQAEQAAEIEFQRKHTNKVCDIYARGQIPSKRRRVHVSDFLGRSICPRKMVLLDGYEQDTLWHSAQLSARFETGNAIHERWQDNFARALGEWDVHIESEFEEEVWRIICHPDMIVPYEWEDGKPEPTIFELKGYNLDEFNRLMGRKSRFDKEIRPRKLPKDAIRQANIYMFLTGIYKAMVVVECKDTQENWAWPIEYNKELVKPLIPVLDQIKQDVDRHKANPLWLPPRLDVCTSPDDPTPSNCAGCSACFADHQERIKMRLPESWAKDK